jgi:hypothetical protein
LEAAEEPGGGLPQPLGGGADEGFALVLTHIFGPQRACPPSTQGGWGLRSTCT